MPSRSDSSISLLEDFDNNRDAILEDFFTFLRFESVSTDPAYKPQVTACSKWLEQYLIDIGLKVESWPTSGHPILFASWEGAGADKPTVLLYGHYDVQPVDPIELWTSPPFTPEIRDGQIYARGSADNKGQILYTILAVKALLERDGELPVNVKFFIEGEEECGSNGVLEVIGDYTEELRSDYLLVVDAGIERMERPAVTIGYRGILGLTVKARGSAFDLHSGIHGGIVINPIHALVEVLASARDKNGHITIPGFYDEVTELSEEERSRIDFRFDEEEFSATFGASPRGGEADCNPLESSWLRPTLEINGIYGGYTGEGFKTVIPAVASAKVSCRLVPDQEPDVITAKVQKFLEENVREGIEITVESDHGGPPMRTSPESFLVKSSAKAYEDVNEKDCHYILCGGTIPVTRPLAEAAGAEPVLLGYGLPTDRWHSPDEHFGIDRFRLGLATIGRILENLAEKE